MLTGVYCFLNYRSQFRTSRASERLILRHIYGKYREVLFIFSLQICAKDSFRGELPIKLRNKIYNEGSSSSIEIECPVECFRDGLFYN
jgi:hypothetical protein